VPQSIDERRAARATRVLSATRSLLSRHGHTGVEPRVLSAKANIVVALDGRHSAGAALVVRSPSRTDLLAGQRVENPWRIHQELALARELAARGGPVVPPAGPDDWLDAGPHVVDGLTLTVWRAAAVPMPGDATPARLAQALRALHAAARGVAWADRMPHLAPVAGDLESVLATTARTGEIAAGLQRRLRAAHDAVVAPLLAAAGPDPLTAGWQAVHGDAHPGNVLLLDGRLVWNDLEDCCLAPVEWDLATLRSTSEDDGAPAVAAYGTLPDGHLPDETRLAPWVRARELERALWSAVRARSPSEVAAVHALLDGLLDRPLTGP
jgi:hypothetical protein